MAHTTKLSPRRQSPAAMLTDEPDSGIFLNIMQGLL
jgi:hypothetical protein